MKKRLQSCLFPYFSPSSIFLQFFFFKSLWENFFENTSPWKRISLSVKMILISSYKSWLQKVQPLREIVFPFGIALGPRILLSSMVEILYPPLWLVMVELVPCLTWEWPWACKNSRRKTWPEASNVGNGKTHFLPLSQKVPLFCQLFISLLF